MQPFTHDDAEKWLKTFIKERLPYFGPNQDAVSQSIHLGNHSLLSPLLNIGLITPREVLDAVLKQFDALPDKKEHIASYEGFIRQLIGWREFCRLMYLFHGKSMFKMNLLNHKKRLTKNWYHATTGIAPIDQLIDKAHNTGYLHHIERLMYMGNFFLLSQIHPKDVYEWFMVCFIDSYEWVMAPNVFGMSQYSLKGMSMMTRPYFSSSNYILKMSDFKKNGKWEIIWDALYYNFVDRHQDLLKTIYATVNAVRNWERKKNKEEILMTAKDYLKYL